MWQRDSSVINGGRLTWNQDWSLNRGALTQLGIKPIRETKKELTAILSGFRVAAGALLNSMYGIKAAYLASIPNPNVWYTSSIHTALGDVK